MSIAGLSTQTQSSDLSLISGASQSAQTTSVNQVMSQGPEASDKAQFSQGGQMMNQLKQLQTSDPTKFKEAAQNISDQLTDKAKNATNSQEKAMYTKMAGDFSEAAKTGQMPTPPSKPGNAGAENGQPGAQKFNAQVGHGDFMNTMSSIVSSALSSVGAGTTAASSSAVPAASTSVAAVASSAA